MDVLTTMFSFICWQKKQVKESNEVGYIKLLLAQKYGLDANKIQLFFNKTPLIDPMSLCDHSGIRPPYVELELRLVS
jgi:hypothetical protein